MERVIGELPRSSGLGERCEQVGRAAASPLAVSKSLSSAARVLPAAQSPRASRKARKAKRSHCASAREPPAFLPLSFFPFLFEKLKCHVLEQFRLTGEWRSLTAVSAPRDSVTHVP